MSKFCANCANPIIKNKYCNPCHAEYMREWRKTNTVNEKQRLRGIARSLLKVHIKRGKIEKQPCIQCGEINVEGHHWDYSKPLDVIWLCKTHHNEVHAYLKKEGITL